MRATFKCTVGEFIARCRDRGLDHVELTTEYLQAHPDVPAPDRIRELAETHDVSVSYHAPFRDWNPASFNDASATSSLEQVRHTLDAAATAGAGAVVVHGGGVPRRYPDHVQEKSKANAIDALQRAADHAATVGVPLCLENQPIDDARRRYTTGPDTLEQTLSAVDADPEWLRVTLDVGHASVNDTDWREHVERFGERITVCHLHANDGESDAHEPLPSYRPILDTVEAEYFVFEMKSLADIDACLEKEG